MRLTAHIFLVAVLATCLAYAQAPAQSQLKYDPASEAEMKGTINEIKEITLGKIIQVNLVMKSGEEIVEVGVCPQDVFKELAVSFATGDEVAVIGSKLDLDSKPFVMAREITKGNDKVVLRDKKGGPVWMWMRK